MLWEKPFIFNDLILRMQQNTIQLIETGLLNYHDAWNLQKKLFQDVTENRNTNYLILTEHPAVITLGKNSDKQNIVSNSNILESQNIDVVEIDRGGDVTFHGPGQIVGYPVFNLEKFKKDVHWYLRSIEEVIIQTLTNYQITATRIKGLTGVWVENQKICAIGIKVTRWVTMHGFALNVATALNYFDHIVPCGISDKSVTSINQIINGSVDIKEVKENICKSFENIFQVEMIKREYAMHI
jgi:lipoyl(octanoyl) transferase